MEMQDILVFLLVLLPACLVNGLRSPLGQQFPKTTLEMRQNGVDPGKPLFLTPYIEKGDIHSAQQLARVGSFNSSFSEPESFSGFLTVNTTYNSNMFFWFFPAQANYTKQPLLLWLQGGPGGSSLFGLFSENGPYGVKENLQLFQRQFGWTRKYHVLYIDNPVGTGFSFTEHDEGYAINEEGVAENLYRALVQFFTLFPDMKDHDFYLTGESYAGKYIPALAHRIHLAPQPKIIHLRGIAIGDGFTDPETMVPQYADFIFQIGLFDENERDYFQNKSAEAVSLIKSQQYTKAFLAWSALSNFARNITGQTELYNYLRTEMWDSLLNGDRTPGGSYFNNITGCSNYDNYMNCESPADMEYYNSFLARPEVRKAIHVGNLPFQDGSKVEEFLLGDIMKSEKDHLAEAMNRYKVLLYTGQLDIIVALPLTEAMLQTVPWQYLDEYKTVKKQIWRVNPSDKEVAGYVRKVHDFYQVLVRGGGHILPYDQPERCFDMIDRFISGRPFA